jgi:uncharacterized protein (TIGR03545 family)
MKQLFRWSGLITFIVVVAAITAFWIVLAGPLIKHGVEYTGAEVVGAEVNLADASIGIAPLQLRLSGLQVTDPEKPTQNMVEFQSAVADLNLWKLMMGQVVISEMSIDGLKFNTPREHPGMVKARDDAAAESTESAKEKAAKALTDMGIELPSIATIMEKEPLLITSRSEELKAAYSEEKAKLDTLQAKLPNEKQLQQYQERTKTLTEGKPKDAAELNRRKQELDKLKQEIKGVKKTLANAKDEVQQSRQTLQTRLSQLKAAPGEDWRRLSGKYNLSQGGALNLSGLLFGDKVQNWSSQALYWYSLAKPYLGSSGEAVSEEDAEPRRATGRFIRFPSDNPTPDFLIKEARLQMALPFGDVMGQLQDITHQPEILGRPVTLKIDAEKLQGAERLVVDGTFDHIVADQAKDSIQFQLTALKLDEVELASQGSFPLQLAHAVSDLEGNITLQGESVEATFNSQFNQAKFAAEAKEGFAGEIAKAVSSIDRFNINGGISGTLGTPDLSLSSDLDKRLNQQLQQRIRAKQAEFERKLRAALEERIAGPQGEYTGKLKEVQSLQTNLQGQIDEYDKMLKAKVSGAQDKAKSDAREKAGGELKKGLESLKF